MKANYEEFIQLMLECYEAFKEVMQKGTPTEKTFAIKGFQNLQLMIKDHLSTFTEAQSIDMKNLEHILTQADSCFKQVCQETTERLTELRDEIEPLLKKKTPTRKKRRKPHSRTKG